MKKLTLVALLAIAAQSALANPINLRAKSWVSPTEASASVYNRFGRPILCHIRVQGITSYGQSLYSFVDHVIYPGTSGYAYVYTNYGNPFVNARAHAHCRWY